MESTKGKDEDHDSYEPNDVQKKHQGWSSKLNQTTQLIWNSSKREFIGRTWDSWAKIGLFYLVFYSSLAAFFAVMLLGFFRTLDENAPTQQKMYSLIKSNPGMGFRPMPSILTTLIRFKQGVPENYNSYTQNLDSFLGDYYKQEGANVVNCSEGTTLEEGEVCRAGKSMFGDECTHDNDYSFYEGRPCIMLKINKVYDWTPEPFNNVSLHDADNKLAQEAKSKLGNRLDPNYIGISCEGENEADADNLGKVSYFPEKGFQRSFFPYKKQPNYRPPIVFVKFNNPRSGVLIQVWCRIWTNKIKHHKNDKAGSIHFELLID